MDNKIQITKAWAMMDDYRCDKAREAVNEGFSKENLEENITTDDCCMSISALSTTKLSAYSIRFNHHSPKLIRKNAWRAMINR